jgi:hypothetical protein
MKLKVTFALEKETYSELKSALSTKLKTKPLDSLVSIVKYDPYTNEKMTNKVTYASWLNVRSNVSLVLTELSTQTEKSVSLEIYNVLAEKLQDERKNIVSQKKLDEKNAAEKALQEQRNKNKSDL